MESLKSISHNQPLDKRWVKYYGLFSRLLRLSQLRQQLTSLLTRIHVSPEIQNIRVALSEILSNGRLCVGVVLGIGGVAFFFAPYLFDPSERDYTWYFINAHYFTRDIRLYVMLILFAYSFLLSTPTKYKLAWLLWSFPASLGFVYLLNTIRLGALMVNPEYKSLDDWMTPEARVYIEQNYHAFPHVMVFTMGTIIGIGFSLTLNYLCYRKYHLKDGNAARIMGVWGLDMSWEDKKEHLDNLKVEMENFNGRI